MLAHAVGIYLSLSLCISPPDALNGSEGDEADAFTPTFSSGLRWLRLTPSILAVPSIAGCALRAGRGLGLGPTLQEDTTKRLS